MLQNIKLYKDIYLLYITTEAITMTQRTIKMELIGQSKCVVPKVSITSDEMTDEEQRLLINKLTSQLIDDCRVLTNQMLR